MTIQEKLLKVLERIEANRRDVSQYAARMADFSLANDQRIEAQTISYIITLIRDEIMLNTIAEMYGIEINKDEEYE